MSFVQDATCQRVKVTILDPTQGGANALGAVGDYAKVYVWDTGLFPLPAGMKNGDRIYSWVSGVDSYRMAACTTAPTSPGKIATANSSWSVTLIYAFAYPSPATNSRLYWQWAHTGNNPTYASKVNSLFIAAVKWAARVPTSKMPHWVRSRRQ